MAVIRNDCPHCGMTAAAMEIVSAHEWPVPNERKMMPNRILAPLRLSAVAYCVDCNKPVGFVLKFGDDSAQYANFMGLAGRLLKERTGITPLNLTVEEVIPEKPNYRIPEHLPEDASDAFRQAEQNYRLGNKEAAISMYGRALETALKWRFVGIKGMLNELIGTLITKKYLSAEIGEWSHQVRLVRKPALHDRSPATQDDLEAARNFADAALHYAITLPIDVAKRRGLPPESVCLGWESPDGSEAEG